MVYHGSTPVLTEKSVKYYGYRISNGKMVPFSRTVNGFKYIIEGSHQIGGKAVTRSEHYKEVVLSSFYFFL